MAKGELERFLHKAKRVGVKGWDSQVYKLGDKAIHVYHREDVTLERVRLLQTAMVVCAELLKNKTFRIKRGNTFVVNTLPVDDVFLIEGIIVSVGRYVGFPWIGYPDFNSQNFKWEVQDVLHLIDDFLNAQSPFEGINIGKPNVKLKLQVLGAPIRMLLTDLCIDLMTLKRKQDACCRLNER